MKVMSAAPGKARVTSPPGSIRMSDQENPGSELLEEHMWQGANSLEGWFEWVKLSINDSVYREDRNAVLEALTTPCAPRTPTSQSVIDAMEMHVAIVDRAIHRLVQHPFYERLSAMDGHDEQVVQSPREVMCRIIENYQLTPTANENVMAQIIKITTESVVATDPAYAAHSTSQAWINFHSMRPKRFAFKSFEVGMLARLFGGIFSYLRLRARIDGTNSVARTRASTMAQRSAVNPNVRITNATQELDEEYESEVHDDDAEPALEWPEMDEDWPVELQAQVLAAFVNSNKGRRFAPRDMSKVQCFGCGQSGHYVGDCGKIATEKSKATEALRDLFAKLSTNDEKSKTSMLTALARELGMKPQYGTMSSRKPDFRKP
jgi:hypothetical protein